MTSASWEMESGAALRARAISASRVIMYCSSGAMVGYGVFLSWACAGRAALKRTAKTISGDAIVLKIFRFIVFSRNIGFSLGCEAARPAFLGIAPWRDTLISI